MIYRERRHSVNRYTKVLIRATIRTFLGHRFKLAVPNDSALDYISQMPAKSTPEERARVLIDDQLIQAGWVVQDRKDLDPVIRFCEWDICAKPKEGTL